nr:ATP-binding protein [Oceaniglobus trochenteri]
MENERRAGQSAKIQAIGQLTTGIAHDFNNILTVVLGNIELARLAPHAAEADESLTEAHRAAERAAGLVAQLLAFSRRAQLNPVPVDAGNMLETFGRTMQRILPATITLRHELAPGLPPILCDRPSLDTALMNLVINARDAMEGRGTITVAITRAEILSDTDDELRPGTYARIAVRDTGSGIPDHLIDRVAEPFFTTKSIGQGSGLGLPMVKGFSEQSGGGLEIANTAAGAEIAMYLPLVTTAAPDSQRR